MYEVKTLPDPTNRNWLAVADFVARIHQRNNK
jgi:hypothetical protein